jgi:hypothetical protein
MAQMMQNGFPSFGSIPPPAHLLRFMMPPFLNPTGLTGGKSLETLQTELKKVRFILLFEKNFSFLFLTKKFFI